MVVLIKNWRKYMLSIAKKHLMDKYDYWNEEILIYKNWGFVYEEVRMR